MLTNLNKENFWNELHDAYPDAVGHFCLWIDQYKKENNWEELFANFPCEKNIKFHDIPFDMQNGIIARYELELYNNDKGNGKEVYEKLAESYKDNIRKIFMDLQSKIESLQEAISN